MIISPRLEHSLGEVCYTILIKDHLQLAEGFFLFGNIIGKLLNRCMYFIWRYGGKGSTAKFAGQYLVIDIHAGIVAKITRIHSQRKIFKELLLDYVWNKVYREIFSNGCSDVYRPNFGSEYSRENGGSVGMIELPVGEE